MSEELTTHTEDARLATQAATGCKHSFTVLVARYSPRLFVFLRRRGQTEHDTQDLVQETFLKAYLNLARYDPKRRFSSWLYTIAANQAISRWRKKSIEPQTPDQDSSNPFQQLIEKERAQNLWQQAARLQRSQFEVLWLSYAEELSIAEIAQALGKTRVHIRVLLHRARSNLARTIMADDQDEPFALNGNQAVTNGRK